MIRTEKPWCEIRRLISPGYDVVAVPGSGSRSLSITAYPGNNGGPESVFQHVADLIREQNASVVCQRVFSSPHARLEGMQALETGSRQGAWPVTWLQGNADCGEAPMNAHLYAVAGPAVSPVYLDGQIVGNLFEDEEARYCFLGGVLPADLAACRRSQAQSAFERIEAALRGAGMGISQVIRTWFFVDRILDWYSEFNSVRTRFFLDWGLFDGVLPASTGIGTANSAGAALVADVLAVQPKHGPLELSNVASPLQCPATNYRSSFSRAVEICVRAQRRLYVSGTASIGPDGRTAHVGDTARQVELTMAVIGAILESRRMNWSDVTRGIAYFKDVRDAPLLARYCQDHGFPPLPVAISSADICRDDLLFELEVDAVA